MNMGKRVLLAGATGYLGGYIAEALKQRGIPFRAIARHPEGLRAKYGDAADIVQAELTRPESMKGCCRDIDVVISTVGITRQKDGLTYLDVDYGANLNLLREAQAGGVERFIYVSVLNGEKLRHLKICDAKERFVDELKGSGLGYCIVRPNGFFSDITDFYNMARKGRVYLFGDGRHRLNPIHGEDLAAVCVDAIHGDEREIEVGGPELLSQNQIAETAFEVLGREPRITHIPGWIGAVTLKLVRTFTGSKTYGPVEFFLTVMAMDMIAPKYGRHTVRELFRSLKV